MPADLVVQRRVLRNCCFTCCERCVKLVVVASTANRVQVFVAGLPSDFTFCLVMILILASCCTQRCRRSMCFVSLMCLFSLRLIRLRCCLRDLKCLLDEVAKAEALLCSCTNREEVLLLLVFFFHIVLLLRRTVSQILLCSFVVSHDAQLACLCVRVNFERGSLVLYLYLWSHVVSQVPCALNVPYHVFEFLVVKLSRCL